MLIRNRAVPTLLAVVATIAETMSALNTSILGSMTPMTELNNLAWYALTILIPSVFACTYFFNTFNRVHYFTLVVLAIVQYYLESWNPVLLRNKFLEQQTGMFVNLWFEYFTFVICLLMLTVDTFYRFMNMNHIAFHISFHSEVVAEVCFWAAYIALAFVERYMICYAVNDPSLTPYVVAGRIVLRLLYGTMTCTQCAIVPEIPKMRQSRRDTLVPVSNTPLLEMLGEHMKTHRGSCTKQNCSPELKRKLSEAGVGMPKSEPTGYKFVIHLSLSGLRDKIRSGTPVLNSIICTSEIGVPALGFTAVALRLVFPKAHDYIAKLQNVRGKVILHLVWTAVMFIGITVALAEASIVSEQRAAMKSSMKPAPPPPPPPSTFQETVIGVVFAVLSTPFLLLE